MQPDVATLGMAIVAVFAANLVYSVILHERKQGFGGDGLWIMGLGALFLAFFLKALTPWIPVLLYGPVSNSLMLTSNLLFAHSIWMFRWGRRFPLRLYFLVPVLLLVMSAVMAYPFHWRFFVFDCLLALGTAFPGVLLLLKTKGTDRLLMRMIAVPFWVYSVMGMIGAVVNWSETGEQSLQTISGYNAWFYLGASIIASVTNYGFFILGNLHNRRVVEKKDREISFQTQTLREQNRAKDLFFSVIAHDLRGPISGVARYTRKHLLGKMTGLEHKYKEVETLAAALDKTNDFLEKLLWWSRSQLLDWQPTWTRVNLQRVFDETGKIVDPLAQAKEISLAYPPVEPVQVMADEECVTLILVNLVGNAIKFSHPGTHVTIETAQAANSFELTVVDEGIGMDERTVERLFLIENKLNTQGTQGEAGSGMGLILAQSLAQRNGGGLEIKSRPGIGTRATLWLPLRTG